MSNTTRILLTGAGFTHNFGTPLASDMWSTIFNQPEIQNSERLRNLFLDKDNKFDYENIYHTVIHSKDFNDGEKSLITKATTNAYSYVNKIAFNSNKLSATKSSVRNHLLDHFKGSYIFTLNQDLFLEKIFNKNNGLPSLEQPFLPFGGTLKQQDNHVHGSGDQEIHDILVQNQKNEKWELHQDKILYIKLHGSSNWYDQDDQSIMIIGRNKEEAIKRHLLLQSYLEQFRKIVNEIASEDEVKILIIGYGFNDPHINKILEDAPKNLSIYIIDPTSAKDWFSNEPKKHPKHLKIVEKVKGYFPYTLLNLFPDDPAIEDTPEWLEIKRKFFDHLWAS